MEFTNDNFIVVHGFAVCELKLAGNELLVYSLIYGFSQDGTTYQGGLTYIASALNISKNSAKSIIDRLIAKGHLQKFENTINGVKFCHYAAITPRTRNNTPVQETCIPRTRNLYTPVQETCIPPVQETCTNNIICKDNNNIPYNIAEQTNLHGDALDNAKGQKTLFRNSEVFSLAYVEAGDYSQFEAQFRGAEYQDIDLVYYFHSVADWSDSSNTKRTARGWLATIRNFIRSDIERGRLHRLTKNKQQEPTFDFAGAAEFLKM